MDVLDERKGTRSSGLDVNVEVLEHGGVEEAHDLNEEHIEGMRGGEGTNRQLFSLNCSAKSSKKSLVCIRDVQPTVRESLLERGDVP